MLQQIDIFQPEAEKGFEYQEEAKNQAALNYQIA